MRFLKMLPTLLVIALTSAIAIACDSDGTGPSERSSFRATWAAKPWNGDGSATQIPGGLAGDTMIIRGVTPANAGQLPSGYVAIRIPFRGVGTYTLNAQDAELVYLLGGDVRTAVYTTNRVGAGTLRVREYADGWISGDVAFEAVAAMDHMPVGTAARFDGEFRVRVQSRP